MKSVSTNYARGLLAEIYAALYLVFKGYGIRKWRYKTPVGEIDLIAEKNGVIVFAEIKLRPTLEDGANAVTPSMRNRISRAASHYLASLRNGPRSNGPECRFDVIVISGFRVLHLDNAWFHTT